MSTGTTERLAIGTVQFGLSYGVANLTGRVTRDEAAGTLSLARSAGIDTLDTAVSYGESEARLGEIGIGGWRVITKLPRLPAGCGNVGEWVRDSVAGSLRRLRLPSLDGLLLHHPDDLTGPHGEALYDALVMLRDEGKCERVGISIYSPEELDAVCPRFAIDLVQAPFNVIDRRLETSGWLKRLHASGTEIHVRSAFLQGLLLMNRAERPARFNRWNTIWDAWDRWLAEMRLTAVEACLGFVLSYPEVRKVVVGIDNVAQMEEILAAANADVSHPPQTLASGDLDLINPGRWGAA